MTECSICLEDINKENTDVTTLRCYHTYHKKCIREWFDVGKNTLCPLCNYDVKQPVGEEEKKEYHENEQKSRELALEIMRNDANVPTLEEINIINGIMPKRYHYVRGAYILYKTLLMGLSFVSATIVVNEINSKCYDDIAVKYEIIYKCDDTYVTEIVYGAVGLATLLMINWYDYRHRNNNDVVHNIRIMMGLYLLELILGFILYIKRFNETCRNNNDDCGKHKKQCYDCSKVLSDSSNETVGSILIVLIVSQGLLLVLITIMLSELREVSMIRERLIRG